MTDVYSGSNKIVKFKFVVSKPGDEDMEFHSWSQLTEECMYWKGIQEAIEQIVSETIRDSAIPEIDDHTLDGLYWEIAYENTRELLKENGFTITEVLV